MAAGKAWDGRRLGAARRMSTKAEDEDVSFAGSLRIRVLAGSDGERRYDVLEYAGDSGTVFRSGTIEVVAELIQCGLEGGDASLRRAIRGLSASTRAPSDLRRCTPPPA